MATILAMFDARVVHPVQYCSVHKMKSLAVADKRLGVLQHYALHRTNIARDGE